MSDDSPGKFAEQKNPKNLGIPPVSILASVKMILRRLKQYKL